MRVACLAMLAVTGACGTDSPIPEGGVGIQIDIPNKLLDPKGYTSIEVTMHTPSGDIVRSASVSNNGFNLGDLDIMENVWVEAVLRNDSGTAVGYGRTPGPVDFTPNAMVTVQMRRPIVYIAGMVSDTKVNQANSTWMTAPATFSDLSVGASAADIAGSANIMISAGPNLFLVEETPAAPGPDPDPAKNVNPTSGGKIRPVSTGDHTVAAPLAGTVMGGVRDGVGSDDGAWLVIGTTTNLYVVKTADGTVKSVATGDFWRVALVTTADGPTTAIAIKNRGSASAELWTVSLAGGEVADAKSIATGGFTDVASDAGRMFAVDSKGELDEIVGSTVKKLRMGLVRPTALAVSNGQAFIGSETTSPVGLSLLVASLSGAEAPRALWSEAQQQVANATDYPGVQRLMTAQTAEFHHLEIGAGGDYVAATSSAHYDGAAESSANFPRLEIDTEELRVFDASSGAPIQRYRSWCDGIIYDGGFPDIQNWNCATSTGQTEPDEGHSHHIQSMTFLFGKK